MPHQASSIGCRAAASDAQLEVEFGKTARMTLSPDIRSRTANVNGIDLQVLEAGDPANPTVILSHGFPEGAYSWRHQLPALAAAGYHAIAPDQRGYGYSSAPTDVTKYRIDYLTGDLNALLDQLGKEQAVFVGHDWGAMIVWENARLHPDRVRAVVGVSVPAVQWPGPPIQLMKMVYQDNFFYILYFQEPGVAEAEFEADIPKTMRTILAGVAGFDTAAAQVQVRKKGAKFLTGIKAPEKLPAWLTEDDVAFFAKEFERSGFRGGLNRYRNMDRDWEELPELADAKIAQPALFITGEKDPVRAFAPAEGMKELVPGLKDMLVIPGAGHWIQQERAAEVNDALLKFLKGL
jgi:pimeloyl-ACP methyl ester carboxylesterase